MKHIVTFALVLLFAVLLPAGVQAQLIYTAVGSGIPGYNGDGGPAKDAQFLTLKGIAFDLSGNLYIADATNNVVRKVNTSGVVSTFAGNSAPNYYGDGGPASAAMLYNPSGVVADSFGNIFIADQYNHVVRKVDTAGMITTIAGNGIASYSGDGGLAKNAQLSYPSGLSIDHHGNLYIADEGNNVIRKINTAGIIRTVAGNGFGTGTATGGYTGDGGLATAAELFDPRSVSIDLSGNLYIADAGNNVVRKVDTSGIITTFAGIGTAGYSGDGGQAGAARLNSPESVLADGAGNIYIADANNNVVRKVNAAGIITTIAGTGFGAGTGLGGYTGDGGSATDADLFAPKAITFDSVGNLYISDSGNYVIRKVTGIKTFIKPSIEADSKVTIQPNPNNGKFTITIPWMEDDELLVISDIFGRVVYEENTPHKVGIITKQVAIEKLLVRGIYFLAVRSAGCSRIIQFIVN